MTVNPIRHITIDAHDTLKLARFWAQVTGYRLADDCDAEEALLTSPLDGSPGMLFIAVPEPKSAKNRMHLDIQPPAGTRDEFVERMLRLGASVHEDHRAGDGTGWVTMLDPEGNEFCVERSAAERAAA
ncbi:VOC family protein [Actinoplanes teichomyceticus]|uniref:Putative enzyme related to lactoylglutathione lyase n=1 Tax=Actinoplanes teichomyceticus TaxID=1867 RepID=A0A561VMI8_ACTTI|nr:VOC family protein [Actinoplanes teichomyceticus]TWG12812.1 putative enzyme related to lactoylglutathione lyase [Actinoplanes teichomyceticus]GIF13557.1 glyoxalase [Actinoplanes teichomyceticus]